MTVVPDLLPPASSPEHSPWPSPGLDPGPGPAAEPETAPERDAELHSDSEFGDEYDESHDVGQDGAGESEKDDELPAVEELSAQGARIETAVALLAERLKEHRAIETVKEAPALKTPNPSRVDIEKILQPLLLTRPPSAGMIYLPSELKDVTTDRLMQAKTQDERTRVIKDALRIEAAQPRSR